jgi:dihydrofolate reductase (trimethoprim resistance protein)
VTIFTDHTTFNLGDRVRKRKAGSRWQGRVVGLYSTTLNPEGYCVESETEHGSVQIYPAAALEKVLTDAVPYTYRELMRRAVRSAKPLPGEADTPRWELVKQLFGTGQGVSRMICKEHGFDPDEEVAGPYIPPHED